VAGGVALSALWLTMFYPPQPDSGPLLFVLRVGFGSAMVASLGLGLAAIRRGDVRRHQAFMTRAYAIALAAGTQVFTEGFGGAVLGNSPLALDVSRGAAWVVNLAVAEWVIRRRRRLVGGARRRRVAVVVGGRT
jgi:KaiC/GvpD/RAD55 family RecA-like ATPase